VLVTTDALVESVHFRRAWGTPRQLGRKAFAVNASDIAAMGGVPKYAVIDLRAPRTLPVRFLEDVYRGFCAAAERHGARLIGGNTSRSSRLSLGVTLLGEAPHGVITRAGCRAGDDLYVTGTIGLAALGLRALRAGERKGAAVRRFLEPPSRVAIAGALARTGLVGGMIDVSDGLLPDAEHLCEASGAGVEIEEGRLPLPTGYRGGGRGRGRCVVLRGGEDYELLFSARPAFARRVARLVSTHRCAVTRVGRVVEAGDGVHVVGARGAARPLAGFDHYRSRS
jgi:thiamine-monophosphate kinase